MNTNETGPCGETPAEEKRLFRAALQMKTNLCIHRAEESAAICRHVLAWPPFREAQTVAGFMPLRQEADITPLLEAVLADGRRLCLPRTERGVMRLLEVRSLSGLTKGAFGIREPPAGAAEVPPEQLDLILVPCAALDRSLYRLGKGGGYYDRLLAESPALTLAPLLRGQWVERVPREPHDQPVQYAVDAEGLHRPAAPQRG